MDQDSAIDNTAGAAELAGSSVARPHWQDCGRATDRSAWNPPVARFFDYWLSIAPAGRLPGRQHFDPLDIVALMPRVWILDVVREASGPRFCYRLVCTREVPPPQREGTGCLLREDRPHPAERPGRVRRV